MVGGIGAGLGAVFSSVSASDDARCGLVDLVPTTTTLDRLPIQCVNVVGAYWVDKEVGLRT